MKESLKRLRGWYQFLFPQQVVLKNKGYCFCCDSKTYFIAQNTWLRDHYLCVNCGSIPRERALMYCIEKFFPTWRNLMIHESSPADLATSRRLEGKNYISSQYFPGVKGGMLLGPVRCENLEHLTFNNNSVDLHVSQDVFEHLFDLAQAFREITRTLKPGGARIFITPLVNKNLATKWCASLKVDGAVEHLVDSPEYHGNPVSKDGSLVTVRWGYDIVQYIHTACGLFTDMVYIDAPDFGIQGEYIEVLITRKF